MDFYVIPLVNPDGYAYTWSDDRMWRKTRTPSPESAEGCVGADANRNWPAPDWENGVGASDDPCEQTYRGKVPLSEPCIYAINTFAERVRQVHPIKAFFDIHSYSQLWLYPRGRYLVFQSADKKN